LGGSRHRPRRRRTRRSNGCSKKVGSFGVRFNEGRRNSLAAARYAIEEHTMSQDRFIPWNKKSSEKPPSKEILKTLIEDYLGGALQELTQDEGRFYAKLVGKPSTPWRRLKGWENYAEVMEQHKERWFEVDFGNKKGLDVITRMTDEYTDVVATGFAEMVARLHETKVQAS
jgi:hypothetical protein